MGDSVRLGAKEWDDLGGKLDGMAGMVARHASFVDYDYSTRRLWLQVEEKFGMYASRPYRDKLASQLQHVLGDEPEVRILIATPWPSHAAIGFAAIIKAKYGCESVEVGPMLKEHEDTGRP